MLARLDSLKFAFNWSSADQFKAVTARSFERFHAVYANLAAARRIRDEIEQASGHHCGLYASSLAYDETQRDRMARVLAEIEPLVDEHYWLPFIGNRGLPGGDEPRPMVGRTPPCATLFTEAHITVDGHLAACSLDASPRFHMADVESDTLSHAWHSPAFQALRRAHLKADINETVCAECIGYT
jgi:radical SAM protein with 4Fe4S-binding SPASM domain